jgi:ATP adenylyltransferase
MPGTLFAPWRLDFILGEKEPGCIFCRFPAEGRDRERLILGRSAASFVILNRYPYNNGHLMVVPLAHVSRLEDLEEAAYDDLARLLRLCVGLVREECRPDAQNVGMNLGRAAGAGIEEHLHWHVVPRWAGDVNFMPVLADTRVMPEHLDVTWARLRPAFDRALAAG